MTTVIKAKGIADVQQGRVIPDSYVTVEGDRITAVGASEALPELPPDTDTVDLGEHILLPGLINSHAHLCSLSDGQSHETLMDLDYEIWVAAAIRNARTELMSGVTTLRDCGHHGTVTYGLRKAMDMGLMTGPRLFVSGRPLTMTGGHCHFFAHEVDGPDEVTRAVRLRLKEGADFIKLMATGGGSSGTYPWYASLSVPEIAAAVETAHRVGKTVGAHCRGIPGIRNVIAGGIDQIEHACFELPDGTLQFDPQIAAEIAEKEIWVTPTIQLYRDLLTVFTRKKEEGALSPREEARLQLMPAAVDEKLRAMEGFLAAGVKCVAGNDAGLPFTGFGVLWQELGTMVDGGMTPMQAIVSATIAAAGAMGLQEETGSLTSGKLADLIAVPGDPTADIGVLSDVSFVMQAGTVHRPFAHTV